MLKRRLSTPRATTAVALAAVLAAAIAVTPSLAGTLITKKGAGKVYVTNKKAAALYLKKKVAGNVYVQKADAPLPPVIGIAAGTAVFTSTSTTAGYIPTAFTSFGTPGTGSAVITFSGNATCTAAKPTPDLACPIQILVDGQTTGKVNVLPATAASTPAPASLAFTVTQTTVLQKGGHTIAVQYAGAKNVAFTLKGWSLAAQAYPQRPEAPAEATK